MAGPRQIKKTPIQFVEKHKACTRENRCWLAKNGNSYNGRMIGRKIKPGNIVRGQAVHEQYDCGFVLYALHHETMR